MKGYIAFTKKELIEQARTYKWLIILAVFFIFGMMSPLLAKIMPDLLSGMDIQGAKLVVPPAKVTDAYAQFFKNMTQMGTFAVLLVFGGTVSNELVKGTLINILSKGLPRHTVLLAKYTAAVILWTVGYIISVATAYGYSIYLFDNAQVVNLFFSAFCLWLFGCFILAMIFLSSTIAPGNFGGLVLTAVILASLLMISMLPDTAKYNPITLASKNTALISGTQAPKELVLTIIITGTAIIISMALSISLFKKRRL